MLGRGFEPRISERQTSPSLRAQNPRNSFRRSNKPGLEPEGSRPPELNLMDPSDAATTNPNVYPLHHHASALNWLLHHSWKGIPQHTLKYPSHIIIYTNQRNPPIQDADVTKKKAQEHTIKRNETTTQTALLLQNILSQLYLV